MSSAEAKDAYLRGVVSGWRNRKRFGKTFTEYKVTVSLPPLEWAVFKRYSEFKEMHKQLQQTVYKKRLPKLPPGKAIGLLKEEFIETRKAQLSLYLEALLAVPEVCSSPVVLTFLGAMTSPAVEGKDISHVQYHLHVDKVCEIVSQGDIFLFHTDGVLQSMQRTLTNSDYDHVGIVVRVPPHSKSDFSLFLLEATSDGVKKYPLRQRLRAWNLSKASMSLRKLNMTRTFELMEKLGKFVSEVDGLPYSLTPMKLLRRTPNADHQSSYFCSELVAGAYRVMGVLPDSVSPNFFLPASFAEGSKLSLLNGASLDREILVSFHVPEVVNATKITSPQIRFPGTKARTDTDAKDLMAQIAPFADDGAAAGSGDAGDAKRSADGSRPAGLSTSSAPHHSTLRDRAETVDEPDDKPEKERNSRFERVKYDEYGPVPVQSTSSHLPAFKSPKAAPGNAKDDPLQNGPAWVAAALRQSVSAFPEPVDNVTAALCAPNGVLNGGTSSSGAAAAGGGAGVSQSLAAAEQKRRQHKHHRVGASAVIVPPFEALQSLDNGGEFRGRQRTLTREHINLDLSVASAKHRRPSQLPPVTGDAAGNKSAVPASLGGGNLSTIAGSPLVDEFSPPESAVIGNGTRRSGEPLASSSSSTASASSTASSATNDSISSPPSGKRGGSPASPEADASSLGSSGEAGSGDSSNALSALSSPIAMSARPKGPDGRPRAVTPPGRGLVHMLSQDGDGDGRFGVAGRAMTIHKLGSSF